MVGPGDVDEDLQPEVAEECAKYGEVERCLIFEVYTVNIINVCIRYECSSRTSSASV